MSTGRFQDAVGALRASAEGAPVHAQRTRGRILSDLRRQRARRAVLLRVLVPLAAVFAGSTAWAAATGYLPESWQAAVAVLGFDESAESPTLALAPSRASGTLPVDGIPADPADVPAPLPESNAPSVPVALPPVQEPVPPPISSPVQPQSFRSAPAAAPQAPQAARPAGLPIASPPAAAPPALPAPQDASPPPAGLPAASDGDGLYAEAHRLHFAERNPAAALSAWDAYLRAAPRGRFSVEAHYNRALCLARLGRTSQAKGALQPFASGAFGGYRQTEARALLDAMAGAER